VAVARAIAKRPEILFCDEPTGSLDSGSGVKVLQAITEVSADVGATTMIVTHNAVVADIAHRVLRFRDGMVTGIHRNAERKSAGELAW
jgi:putative ABC transport system ATP-binding protein